MISKTPDSSAPLPEVSIIIPARNEEANLAGCLQSLIAQTEVAFEIIVVDDASTDRTHGIAQQFAQQCDGLRLISVEGLTREQAGKSITGKNNALIAGARVASAQWLLFTDADTVHLPGSLARAFKEAESEKADLLSYSPEQIVVTFAERAVMPVIFAELAVQYPPHKVRDQNSSIVAANGQYILVRRGAYEAVGGHAAVASEILEDVALAKLFRDAGFRVFFRYGGGAVRTRMYRTWPELREGWTKNLALLFPNPTRLAAQSVLFWYLAWSSAAIAVATFVTSLSAHPLRIGFVAFWLLTYRRIRSAHFSISSNLVAMAFGLPMFAYLLLRSKAAHKKGKVVWKGRAYDVRSRSEGESTTMDYGGKRRDRNRRELNTEN
jgi:glycosyltransferase involved in cell wall biosynthesis